MDEAAGGVLSPVRVRKLTEKGLLNALTIKKKKRKDTLKLLRLITDRLYHELQSGDVPVTVVRREYSVWLTHYGEFLDVSHEYRGLLSEEERDKEKTDFTKHDLELRQLKHDVEQWLLANDKPPSRGSVRSRSSRVSQISMSKMQEATKKVELLAKMAALTQKKVLEEKRLSLKLEEGQLKLEEEELQLKTDLAVCEAKTRVYEEFEGSDKDSRGDILQDLKDLEVVLSTKEKAPEPEIKMKVQTPDDLKLTVRPKTTLPSLRFDERAHHSMKPSSLAMHSTDVNPSLEPVVNLSSCTVSDSDGLLAITRELRKPTSDLQKFSGNPMEYTQFVRQFNARINAYTDSFEEKINYLLQFTTGEAHKIVKGYANLDSMLGYQAILEEFKDRYGDTDIVAQAYVKKALTWPTIKPDNSKALDEFSIFLRECLYAVENVRGAQVLDYSENLKLLVRKLPVYLHDKWRNIVYDLKDKSKSITFSHLVNFVRKEAKKALDPTYGREVMYALGAQQKTVTVKPERTGKSFATKVNEPKKTGQVAPHTATPSSNNNRTVELTKNQPNANGQKSVDYKSCLHCESNLHVIGDCHELEKLTLKERYAFLRTKGLCYGCLCVGHQRDSCRKRLTCSQCNRLHPTVLHVEPRSSQLQQVSSNSVALSTSCNSDTGAGDRPQSAVAIVPVKIKSKFSDKYVETYAFLDSGCTTTFCTEDIMRALNITGRKTRINIHTMGQDRVQNSYLVSDLEVISFDGDHVVELPPVYTQPSLPVSSKDVVTTQDLVKWPYLKRVPLHSITSEVGLMIGVNVPTAMQPIDVIASQNNGPYAVKTVLGWVINGALDAQTNSDNEATVALVNRVTVEPVSLEDQIRDHVNRDFTERIIDDEAMPSKEDKQFLESVSQSIVFRDGHYVIGLPFKDKNVKMPNNRSQAVQRMECLKRKFGKDNNFHELYTAFMNKLFDNGYARVVSDQPSAETGRIWYLPHHGVFHPQKGKLRVVFDCAAKYGGTSLNDKLLQGPNLTNSLAGTLLRFREEKVAMMADIQTMFYRVQVPDKDAHFLRFLWWENGDVNRPVVEYQMVVHIFGAASSPACANYALRKTADENESNFPQAAQSVRKNFYVDDLCKSVPETGEAIALAKDLRHLCDEGGFNLTAWVSNDRDVMATIPVEHWAKGVKDLDLQSSELPIERALGVQWCVETDTFRFQVKLKERPITRRGILATTYSVYDPLGFISPVVLQAKCILQDLCRLNLGWDDKIPEPFISQWEAWLQDIHKLTSFSVNRCVKPPGFEELASAQLHHFSDASESGYGVTSYLRLENTHGQVHCCLVQAKSRVTPLKQTSIVRLELTAATVAVRIDAMLRKELDISLGDSCFWTDSTAVIKYVQNETSRFQTFVANRLQVIHEGSKANLWRYIKSSLNPADVASRGQNADMFVQNKHWLHGPDLLWDSSETWPSMTPLSLTLDSNDPEVKKTIVSASVTVTTEMDSINRLITSYSSWYRLKRAVAWILRVKSMLRERVKSRRKVDPGVNYLKPLTIQDIDKSETAILSYVQQSAYNEEIQALAEGRTHVKQSSSLRKLSPIFKDSLLRVGGRLSKSALPYDSKFPVILPKGCHVSTLILQEIHAQVMHGGRNQMLSKLRQKYWLCHAPSAIRRIIAKCVICRRLNAKVGEQLMGDLPSERLTVDEPPFTNVSCDLFGHFEVKRGRSRTMVKRYGVIFTCMTIRAIHIEVVESLDTDSFISALRRFIARRGQVKRMRSDNGSNLVRGERELREAIQNWNKDQIHEFMLQQNIDWNFNPPLGSHHGGVVERQIRTVRKCLNSAFKEQSVTSDEGLRTLMCEVEAVVNDRPITKISDSHCDLEALTPNHLLLMKVKPNLPPGLFSKDDNYGKRRWRQIQFLADLFWKRWSTEYLTLLQERKKWTSVKRNLQVGDIVLLVDSNAPRNSWLLMVAS